MVLVVITFILTIIPMKTKKHIALRNFLLKQMKNYAISKNEHMALNEN